MTEETAMFKNALIRIEIEESEVPWLKIFTQVERREFSECKDDEKAAILEALDVIEKEMLSYYRPTKINIASFGNYVPLVHWHIMARFKDDSFFPEPMWGAKQRVASLALPPFVIFCRQVNVKLEKVFREISLKSL
ncbi:MAG: HIT family protein [Thiovulaceae bacterium]|nr:HIT family protein [Sulfurimonadaceae bacterium]